VSKLSLKEIEPYVLQVTGINRFYIDKGESVEVNGKRYYRTERTLETFDYDELFKHGKLNKIELPCFAKLFTQSLFVYYYSDSDFYGMPCQNIQSFYGRLLGLCLDFYGFKWSWGRGWCKINEYEINKNSFPFLLYSGYGTQMHIYVTYQYALEHKLLNSMKQFITHINAPLVYQKLFCDVNNDFEMVDRLIAFNDYRNEILLTTTH